MLHIHIHQSFLTGPLSVKRWARQSLRQPVLGARGSLIDAPEVTTAVTGSEHRDVVYGNHLLTANPTVAEGDNVLWSRWDNLPQSHSKPR